MTDFLTKAAKTIIEEGLADGISFFDSAGWRRLDDGTIATTRYAFETDRDTVVKVAMKEGYNRCNRKEATGWQKCGDDSLVAPVVDHGPEFNWLEMEKCRRVGKSDRSIRTAYEEKLDDSCWHIADLHLGNLGILPETREIVCYDYPTIERKL